MTYRMVMSVSVVFSEDLHSHIADDLEVFYSYLCSFITQHAPQIMLVFVLI